jgi:hypothetical protein
MILDGIVLTEGSTFVNAVIASGADFPSNPSVGELFFNTSLAVLHVYNGADWISVGGGGGSGSGGPFTISGDVSGLIDGGVDALTLRSVNATPVTLKLQKITTNAKGLVTETVDATPQDIIDALGYTPANGSAAGTTGQVQYNGGNSTLAASSRFVWSNSTSTLTLGALGASATIAAPEELSLVIGGNTALNIEASGVWKLGSSPGVSGNVLTSTGTGAPVWANVNGLLAGTPVVTSQSIALQGDVIVTPTPYGNGNISPVATLATRLPDDLSAAFRLLSINTKGLIVGTSAVQPSNIISALGYSPARSTGETFTGPVYLSQSPQTGLEAATKAYVDAVAQGVAVKASARVATTTNITLSGIQTVDDVLLQVGDRVVVKNQTDVADNGVYIVSLSSWTRTADTDTGDELEGAFVFVSEGTINASTGWFQSTPAPITIGTTDIVWSQFSGAGAYSAGAGLTLTGGEFSLINAGTPLSAFFGRITTNTKGQVVSSEQATSADIINALGYTPISVGGGSTQVQFNNNGVLGGSTGLTFASNKLAINDTLTSTAGAAHLTVTPASPTQELRLIAGNAPEGTTASGGDVIIRGGAHGGFPVAPSFGAGPNNQPILIPPAPLEAGNVIIEGGTTPGQINTGTEEAPSYSYMEYFSTGNVTIRTRPAGGSNGVTGVIKLQTADIDRLTVGSDGSINIDTARLTINSDEWYIDGNPGLPGQVLASTGSSSSPAWIDVGAGTVTSISGSGGTTGLSLTGGPITNIGTLTIGGTLNVANGGTGATSRQQAATNILPIQTGNAGRVLATDGTTASWEDPATVGGGGSGSVTSIDISGGLTGLTTSGGPITSSGTITLGGTLSIGSGGTGQTTRAAAINALLPTQANNSGKYLLSNGTDVTWASVVASGAAGTTGNFQYNQGGSFAAFTELAFDDATSILTVGTNGVGTIEVGNVEAGSTLSLIGGSAIILTVGEGMAAKSIQINASGAIRFGGTYGSAGQILTSYGNAADAVWADPPTEPSPLGDSGAVQYNNAGVFDGANGVKIVSGTRLNVTGIVEAGEFNTTGRIFLATNGTIQTDDSLDLGISAGNFFAGNADGGDGGDVSITAGAGSNAGNAGGSVTISAGQGVGDANGGSIILRAASGSGVGSNGVFQVRTSPPGAGVGTVNRLTINEFGAWFVDEFNTPGSNGQALITNSNGIPSWQNIPPAAPAGTSGQMQWNNAGATDATAQMSYNGSNTLSVGLATGTFIVQGQNGTSTGGAISITSGTATGAGGIGGALNLTAGSATTAGATGGNVVISSGTGVSNAFGVVILRTGATERFRILNNGAWSVGSSGTATGAAGQVLTSTGATTPPTWQSAAVTSAIANTAALGTSAAAISLTGFSTSSPVAPVTIQAGSGTSGSGNTLNLFGGGAGNLGVAGGAVLIQGGAGASSAAGGPVTIAGGSTGSGTFGTVTIHSDAVSLAFGGAVNIRGGNGHRGGSLSLSGGNSSGNTHNGGNLSITGGDANGTSNAGNGGNVSIRAGNTNGTVSGLAGTLTLSGGTATTGAAGGAIIFQTAATNTLSERLRINANGSWGLAGAANYGTAGFVLTSNGDAAPTWGAVSDERLKENIVDAPSALSKLTAIQVRSYDWKESGEHVEHGFVAQELHLAEPAAVATVDTWTIEPAKLVPVLTKALQEMLEKVEMLEQRIAQLENQLE